MKNQWVLKPGERLPGRNKAEDVIEYYISEPQNFNKNLIITTDDDVIYFVCVEQDDQIKSADVAMRYGDQYYFLPREMAHQIAESHVLRSKLLSNAHEFLEAALD